MLLMREKCTRAQHKHKDKHTSCSDVSACCITTCFESEAHCPLQYAHLKKRGNESEAHCPLQYVNLKRRRSMVTMGNGKLVTKHCEMIM